MKTVEIKLVDSAEKRQYRVLVDGVDACPPYEYGENKELKRTCELMAKAAAFDLGCISAYHGRKFDLSINVF